MTPFDLLSALVNELHLPKAGIAAVVKLFNEGNTIPFIARYRKEATGSLDELQIRTIQERLTYLTDLENRRQTILESIEAQGKLSDALKEQICACVTKNTLEDLYLPYKPKRRTRAAIARERGLEPLAKCILGQLQSDPVFEAQAFINAEKGVEDGQAALVGARDIVAEWVAEDAAVRSMIREVFASEGIVVSKVVEEKALLPTKFEQYYDFKEPVAKIPSHRYLAIRRGEREEVLQVRIEIEVEPVIAQILKMFKLNPSSPYAKHLEDAVRDGYKRLLIPSIETDLRVDLKVLADSAAVEVFADNLRNLLLAPPLGARSVIGIDPGIRTGCKCTAVDETGKYLDCVTIYLHRPEEAANDLFKFIERFQPEAIGIGNGTAGRETEAFVKKMAAERNLTNIIILQVNESGASVYSASDIAREEFPNLDVTIRGAVSIARRLQDPLAELVKIDPKAIGVGQYQHDVYQPLLQEKLGNVVESCVNHVGVEVNTASAPLLAYVAGIGSSLAAKIVKHREQHGAFKSRFHLLDVSGLGSKTYEQAAGFLRVRGGEHPLDASAVHPERYHLVEQIAKDMNVPLSDLIANATLVRKIDKKRYMSDTVGDLTLEDIITELQKPGRDPRAAFEKTCFRDDVTGLQDIKAGMKLEGIVTNVTAFGAFVDIGVHQDGLVHISELTDRFIKDPREVVRVGQKIKVEVLTVDVERKRIALTAKSGSKPKQDSLSKEKPHSKPKSAPFSNNPFASL